MRVFISYPHADTPTAEGLAKRLQAEGHEVFWDRTSLPSGESFDDRIRDGIEGSDLFVCLVRQGSLDQGHYARTELKFAEEKWANPSGRVLPVALDDDVVKTLPPYLKAVTILRPVGDPVAEVAAQVRRIARRPIRRLLLAARAVAVVGVVAVVGWLVFRGLPGDPIQLTVGMSGYFYADSAERNTQVLRAATAFVRLFDRGLSNEEHVDGQELLQLLDKDEMGPTASEASPLPILHFGIVNNSDETIVVDRLRLSVGKSQVDLRPLLWSSSTMRHTNAVLNGSFELGNDGWGTARDLRFAFDIVPEPDVAEARSNASRRFTKELPSVESGAARVNALWEELAAFGADVSFLRDGPHPFDDQAAMARFDLDLAALHTALGARAGEPIWAIGELTYAWGDGERAQLSLKQEIQIVYPGPVVAPALLAQTAYDIELRPEGTNYVVERQIAHSLAPGAAEAIDLRVWVKKSSLHDMTAAIRVGEKWVEAEDALRLEYYRPVHSTWEGQGQP